MNTLRVVALVNSLDCLLGLEPQEVFELIRYSWRDKFVTKIKSFLVSVDVVGQEQVLLTPSFVDCAGNRTAQSDPNIVLPVFCGEMNEVTVGL